jgi:ABC-type sulfate/molybdate transport systems ATPase subunit
MREKVPYTSFVGLRHEKEGSRSHGPSSWSPKVVSYDEPIGGARSPQWRGLVVNEIRRARALLSQTSVLVTSRPESGLEIADRIAILLDGSLLKIARLPKLWPAIFELSRKE